MANKFVVLVALVAVAHCAVMPVAQVDSDTSSFSYDVADPNTGDYKSQSETRTGGNVVGQYSLIQPDGTRRTVDYTADDVNGFNAVVRNDPAVVAVSAVNAAHSVTATPIGAPESVVVNAPGLASRFIYKASAVPSVYNRVGPYAYSAAIAPSGYASPVSWGVPGTYSPYYF